MEIDHQRELGLKVKPKGTKAIRKVAHQLKDRYFVGEVSVDVVLLLEKMQNDDLVEIEILDPEDALFDFAVAFPDIETIHIPTGIYVGAADNNGHFRFTIAHEIGHINLHKGQGIESDEHKIYEDSEWQADIFASELLIDSRILNINDSVERVSRCFNVSEAAAASRLLRERKAA